MFPVFYGAGTLWMKGSDGGLDRQTVDAFKSAMNLGYRRIDAAQMYNTESELGTALQESGLPRSEVSITTKTLDLDNVEQALETSLGKLQTDYVDIYLIHTPFIANSKKHLQSAWCGMERCVNRGWAKRIGVSSFTVEHIEWILETATIKPAMNQIEMHPYVQQPELMAYLKQHQIDIQGFAALTPLTKVKNGPANELCKILSEKYGVGEAAILLRWVIDQGATVVTTSGKKDRLAEYLTQVISFQLTAEDIQKINEASKNEMFRGFFAQDFENWEMRE